MDPHSPTHPSKTHFTHELTRINPIFNHLSSHQKDFNSLLLISQIFSTLMEELVHPRTRFPNHYLTFHVCNLRPRFFLAPLLSPILTPSLLRRTFFSNSSSLKISPTLSLPYSPPSHLLPFPSTLIIYFINCKLSLKYPTTLPLLG